VKGPQPLALDDTGLENIQALLHHVELDKATIPTIAHARAAESMCEERAKIPIIDTDEYAAELMRPADLSEISSIESSSC
jgi:hypothetical protein